MAVENLMELMLQAHRAGRAIRIVVAVRAVPADDLSGIYTVRHKLSIMHSIRQLTMLENDWRKVCTARWSQRACAYMWPRAKLARTITFCFRGDEEAGVKLLIDAFVVQGGHGVESAEIVDMPEEQG